MIKAPEILAHALTTAADEIDLPGHVGKIVEEKPSVVFEPVTPATTATTAGTATAVTPGAGIASLPEVSTGRQPDSDLVHFIHSPYFQWAVIGVVAIIAAAVYVKNKKA